MSTLFSKATILDVETGRARGPLDLLVEEGRIAEIEKSIERDGVSEIVDCRGLFLLPGFVQSHVHLCQTLFRNRAEERSLLPWLRERIWPLEAAHSAETMRASARLGIAELLLGGTTCILDMGSVAHTEAIFEAAEELGIRATIGKALMDSGKGVPGALLEDTQTALDTAVRLADEWHGRAGGRLRWAFSPRFLLSASEKLFRASVEEARRRGCVLHTHTAESRKESEEVEEILGKTPFAFLREVGFLGRDVVLVHCVDLGREEIELLSRTGTSVAHCPSSNLKLASGVADIVEFLSSGVNVSLGADGAPCNNRLDVFSEMRLAGLLQTFRKGPGALKACKILSMATEGGARALGLENEIGTLQAGKKADLILLDLDLPHTFPALDDPAAALVYAADPRNVKGVWVEGKRLVAEGRPTGFDLESIREEARRALSEIKGRFRAQRASRRP